jgi:hypothetical protein
MQTTSLHPQPRRPRLGPVALLLVLAALAGAGAGWAGDFVPVGNGVSVRFEQLNWLSDDPNGSPSNYSAVGQADFAFDSTATQLIGQSGGAYLNLYTSVNSGAYQREVQDLFLQFDSSDQMLAMVPSVQFDLGVPDGTQVGSVSFQVSLTSSPVGGSSSPNPPPPSPPPSNPPSPPPPGTTMPPATGAALATSSTDFQVISIGQKTVPLFGQPVYNANVTPQAYHVGGFNGGGSGARPQVGAWGGNGGLAARPVAWGGAAFNQIPAINEDLMGCAPAGIARSIRYMMNLKGRQGPDAQTIYQGLRGTMQTGANGTTGPNMVNGKAAWAAANGLNINTGFVNAGQAMNILANGGDVEINIGWQGGGHVAMIVQIVLYSNGIYQITYVDDGVQGDGAASNTVHTILVAANGAILGTNAWVSGLLGETMQ